MKDFFILKILDRFKFIFKKLNVDYPVLRKNLQIKLLMDTRRLPSNIVNNSKNKKEKNYFTMSLFVYAFMGLLLFVPLVVYIDNLFTLMSIIFSILLFLIASTVIAEFSSVLLDIRDKTIILTKPVDNKTLSIAKFIHVLIYLSSITLSLTAPLIIALFIKFLVIETFIFSLLFIIVLFIEFILLNLFIIVVTTLFYIFIIRYLSGEKLKDIINYVQILLTITLVVGYQIVIRIFPFNKFLNFDFSAKWYHSFLPPLWFGAPFEVLFNQEYDIIYLIMFSLLIVVPLVAFIIYLKLIPKFEESLLKYHSYDNKQYKIKKWHIPKILVKKEEQPFYKFSSLLMKREREFKLRVYPSLGFSIIVPFLFIFQGVSVDINYYHFFSIYFCALMIPPVVLTLSYSSNYKGAWVYYSLPINNLNLVVKGTLKAFIIRLLLPVFIIESIIFIYLLGTKIIIDLVVVLLVFNAFVAVCSKLSGNKLPMSQSIENISKGQGMFIFLSMMILSFFALVHFIISYFTYGIYIYCLFLLLFNFLIWKISFRKKTKRL